MAPQWGEDVPDKGGSMPKDGWGTSWFQGKTNPRNCIRQSGSVQRETRHSLWPPEADVLEEKRMESWIKVQDHQRLTAK